MSSSSSSSVADKNNTCRMNRKIKHPPPTLLLWVNLPLHVLLVILLLFAPKAVHSQVPNDLTVACESLFDCTQCLDNPNSNCVFSLGLCFSECSEAVAGATCYSSAQFPDASSTEQICGFVANDIQLCQQQLACGDCVAAIKADGTTCQWYESAGACFGGGTGPFGPGATTCADDGAGAGDVTPDDATEPPIVTDTDAPTSAPTIVEEVTTETPTSSPTVNCAGFFDCDTCVDVNCAWAVGACLDSCDRIGDAACYSFKSMMNTMNTTNATQICDLERNQLHDTAACAGASVDAPPTDCASCTAISLVSDPTRTCVWFPDTMTCVPDACDMNGMCGVMADQCEATTEAPTATDGNTSDCQAAADCTSCLDLECAWHNIGECAATCGEIADTSCYALEYFPGLAGPEICESAANADADAELCFAQSDCATCISTVKSDGTTTCQWYHDEDTGIQWCQTGGCDTSGICGMTTCEMNQGNEENTAEEDVDMGSNATETNTTETDTDANTTAEGLPLESDGATVTDNDTNADSGHPCYAFDGYGVDGCEPCLSSEHDCAWILNSCEPSCDTIADAPCLHPSTFPENATIPEMCASHTVTQADVALCGSKTYCFTCTSTEMSDGVSTCSWYKNGVSGEEWCGIGGCDANGICGSSNEDVCQVETDVSEAPPAAGADSDVDAEEQPSQAVNPSSSATTTTMISISLLLLHVLGVIVGVPLRY